MSAISRGVSIFIMFCLGVVLVETSSFYPIFIFFAVLVVIVFLTRKPALMMLISFFFGFGWFVTWSHLQRYSLVSSSGSRIVSVISQPVYNGSVYRFKAKESEIRMVIYADILVPPNYGDTVEVDCQKSGREPDWSFRGYLAKERVQYFCRSRIARVVTSYQGRDIKSQIYETRKLLIARVFSLLPEPHSSLVAGFIFGGTHLLTDSLVEDFRKTGTTHIVAASGYNVSVMLALFLGIFTILRSSRRGLFWVGTFSIILYLLLSGGEASILRAGIMGWLLLLSQLYFRYAEIRLVLIWTALVMLIMNPLYLMHDIGFQLSFLATIGLIFGVAAAQRILSRKGIWRWLAAAFLPSAVAFLVTAPLIAYHFGALSWISPLVNSIIAPLVPLAMLGGMLTMLIGDLPLLGEAASGIVWLSTEAILTVVQKAAGLSFGYSSETPLSVVEMAGSYTLFILSYYLICVYIKNKKSALLERLPFVLSA